MQFWEQNSAVQRKKVWVGAVLGRRGRGREKDEGGVFNVAVSQPAPLIILVPPKVSADREEGEKGVACVEVWVSQGWAMAADSWAFATYVLQLQPELWSLGNGSQPNYNESLPIRWHFSYGDCRVCRIQGEGGRAISHWPSLFFLCMRTAREWDLIGWRRKRCFMIWRGRAGGKLETGDVALMVQCCLFNLWQQIFEQQYTPPWKTFWNWVFLSYMNT